MSVALYASIESTIRPTRNSAMICSLSIHVDTGVDTLGVSLLDRHQSYHTDSLSDSMANGSGAPILELLSIFIVVYVLQVITAFAGVVGSLFVLSPPVSENPWTIVTSIYAHDGFSHLLSNAIALVLFGWPVARATSRLRFHLFVVVSGSIAGITQILVSDAAGVLGASGAVFALLGYLLAGNRLSSSLARIVRVPAWVTFAVFVVIAAAVTLATASPGVALIAHFAGLLVGLFAGRVGLLDTGSRRQQTEPTRV